MQQREPAATERLRSLAPQYFASVREEALDGDVELPHSAGVECFLLLLERRRKKIRGDDEGRARD